jgi:hypothetical protein
VYKRQRYYHADLGRFLSRDPIGYVDGMSLYAAYFVILGLDPLGLQLFYHRATVDEAVSILSDGFKPGQGSLSWFASNPKSLGGPSMACKTIELSIHLDDFVPDSTVTRKQLTEFWEAAKKAIGNLEVADDELRRAIDSKRWELVKNFLASEKGKYFRIELGSGKGYFAVIRHETSLFKGRIMGIRGIGSEGVRALDDVIQRLGAIKDTVANSKWGPRALAVGKGVGRALILVGIAADGYALFTAENKTKEITIIAGGWAGASAGAWGGGIGGGAVGSIFPGAGTAVVGTIGAIGGGIGGYFAGRAITKTVYEWVFEEGYTIEER